MVRKRYQLKAGPHELNAGERTLLMGILNVTPDSFSDGGRFLDPDRAFAQAVSLEEQGADIIDVGAESTRPGSQRISEEEELRRLIPVLKRLRGRINVPISVDTYKSAVAERALQLGAVMVNDPSGLTFDPNIAKVAVQHDAVLILNHMRGTPETWAKLPSLPDPGGVVFHDLQASISRARRAGLDPLRLVIDPGLGFGKRKEENTRLIAQLKMLAGLDLPILAGPSRKSFLAQPSPEGTLLATAAAVTACILHGAHIVRVHDVGAMMPVVQLADSIARAH